MRIKLISAFLLMAFALILTGCGGSSDSDAGTSQSVTEPSAPTAAPVTDGSEGEEPTPIAAASEQAPDDHTVGDKEHEPAQEQPTAAPKASANAEPQVVPTSAADIPTEWADDQPGTDPDIFLPTEAGYDNPDENDNAEVSIDDL